MKARLGVNIDHVATLRQQRGESYPSVAEAAECSLKAGADQITIHLREDRRHIQDFDVALVHDVCKKYKRPLNLEMGANPEIVSIAIHHQPEWVCLVPEKRQERTTEGGLNLLDQEIFSNLQNVILLLKKNSPQTKISLFVESNLDTLKRAHELQAHAVEIHTGDYAQAYIQNKPLDKFKHDYQAAFEFCAKNKIHFHAGHGLTNLSLKPLLEMKIFEEYNIGHWIISDAIFHGLENVIKSMIEQIDQYPIDRT